MPYGDMLPDLKGPKPFILFVNVRIYVQPSFCET